MIEQGQTVLDETGNHFLCLCLRGRWDPAALQAAHALSSRVDLDWDSLRKTVHSDALTPLLYCIVRGQKLVPPSVEREWRRSYHLSLLHSTRSFHELGNVLRHLAAAGVTVMLLKGAALAETVYGNAALRPMIDLDLLLPAAEVGLAQTVLASSDYAMQISDPWPGFSQRYRNSLAYQRPSGGKHPFRVGLHWALLDIPHYERIPMADWFGRAQPVHIADAQALVPAAEDHLVYMCGHLALHHQYDPALFRYYDLAMLIHHTGDGLDWDGVVQRAVDWRLVIPLQRTLARLEELWPGTVPAGVAQEVAELQPTRAERCIHNWVVDRRRTPTSDTLLSLVTMPGLARRVRFLLEVVFPGPAYMRQRYCRGCPALWPLAYLQRAGLGLQYLLQRLK